MITIIKNNFFSNSDHSAYKSAMFQNSFIQGTVTFFAQGVFLFQAGSGVKSVCYG
jgi:hypothetical protein